MYVTFDVSNVLKSMFKRFVSDENKEELFTGAKILLATKAISVAVVPL